MFCVDEKSQIQALQRSQPGLPMKPGRAGTFTHGYKRHGTTTLFAALNVLEGTVIGSCLPRHRPQEFRKFLNLLDTVTRGCSPSPFPLRSCKWSSRRSPHSMRTSPRGIR